MPKSKCLKIPKKQGETALALVRKLGLVDKTLKIQRDKTHLYVPLVNKPPRNELKSFQEQIRSFEVVTHPFPERRQQQPSLAELLKDELPKSLLSKLPHAADLVGGIGIVEIPSELQLYKDIIGEAILGANKNLQTVLAKAGAVSGSYRLREFTTIAGVQKTETIHSEYGCRFYVDVAKTYFSPRLSYEHNRVASLVQEGETVVDLFSGIGPFAIMIARRRKNVKIYAVDMNPDAVAFLKKNTRLNRVDGKVHPILGDARQAASKKLAGVADRVIMNLPESTIEFVDAACHALKPQGGIVHFYSFTTASVSLEDTQNMFAEAVKKSGRKVTEFLFCRSVRETAPHENQVVLDARVR
jgi:tRNA (guanine37-N1)-methyltransferase